MCMFLFGNLPFTTAQFLQYEWGPKTYPTSEAWKLDLKKIRTWYFPGHHEVDRWAHDSRWSNPS